MVVLKPSGTPATRRIRKGGRQSNTKEAPDLRNEKTEYETRNMQSSPDGCRVGIRQLHTPAFLLAPVVSLHP